jgi:hypothetical protein
VIVRGGDNDVHLCYAIAVIFSDVFALPPSVHWISKIPPTFFGEQQHCRNVNSHTHTSLNHGWQVQRNVPHTMQCTCL